MVSVIPVAIALVIMTIFMVVSLAMNIRQSRDIRTLFDRLNSHESAIGANGNRIGTAKTDISNIRSLISLLQSDVRKLGEQLIAKEEPTELNWPIEGTSTETKVREAYKDISQQRSLDITRKLAKQYPHYYMNVEGLEYIDVYRILNSFSVRDATLQHSIKKLLACGNRGSKDFRKDLTEVIDTLNRRLLMLGEDNVE